jgi:hypothetical protein
VTDCAPAAYMEKRNMRERASRAGADSISDGDSVAMDRLVAELARPDESSIAVISGAGASKPFGYPLTRELMLKIFLQLQKSSGSDKGQKELYDFLCDLLPGERASQDRVPLVTGVLSLLDHALATGQANAANA